MDQLPLDFSKPKYDLLLSPPVMNAAGILGFSPQPSDLVDFGQLGAFVTNPVSLYPRTPARARTSQPYPGGFLLHSGYPNPGLRAVIKQYASRWARSSLPVIVHLLVDRVDELSQMVSSLEGMEGLMGIELGLPPDCEPRQAVELVQAALGELPLIARVPIERAGEFTRLLVESSLTAISLAPPRGAVLDRHGHPVRGRLFGPAVFPLALAAAQEVIEIGVPVIASGGVYQQRQVEALLEMGAIGVQLDTVLWSLGKLKGWK
ncbi:MAG: nitronate monooxygenase [Anaerolineales bacterium]